jgi:hypothetical protein
MDQKVPPPEGYWLFSLYPSSSKKQKKKSYSSQLLIVFPGTTVSLIPYLLLGMGLELLFRQGPLPRYLGLDVPLCLALCLFSLC